MTFFFRVFILKAVGADPQALYGAGKNAPKQDAVSLLTALDSYGSSAWVAPYTLAALNDPTVGIRDYVLADGDALEWFYVVDYTSSGGCVMPQKSATRAEIAQVFYNLLAK